MNCKIMPELLLIASCMAVADNAATEKIKNASFLHPFFEKLIQLENTKKGKINVLHIGDSHVWSPAYSKAIRQSLQKQFGNGGRGFVVPYFMDRSSAQTISFTSNVPWQNCRNNAPLTCDPNTEFGMAGYGLSTDSEQFVLTMEIGDAQEHFNTIKIVSSATPSIFSLATVDNAKSSGFRTLEYQRQEQFASVYSQNKPLSKISLLPAKKQACYNLNGIILENDASGVVYHNIGTLGSQAFHFNGNPLFFEQIPVLSPDLVIISFGTNEAFGEVLVENFIEQIDLLMQNVKKMCPNASILVTTPPTSLLKRGKLNTYSLEYSARLMQRMDIPLWDLYSFTGGLEGAKNPKAIQIGSDNVHYTAQGYTAQGTALINALMNEYKYYKQNRKIGAK